MKTIVLVKNKDVWLQNRSAGVVGTSSFYKRIRVMAVAETTDAEMEE